MTNARQDNANHEVTTGSRRAFDGKLLHVRVDDVRHPSGHESVREVVEHPGSVVVVPLTVDGRVITIRQYRHVTGREQVELPAGLLDEGEDVGTAAARELREETGYVAGSMEELATVFVSPGYSGERSTILLARDCRDEGREADPDEPIALEPRTIDEIRAMLIPGSSQIENAQAMIGLLLLLRMLGS